jgi:hypothetical protein
VGRKKVGIHSTEEVGQATSLKGSEGGFFISMTSQKLYIIPLLFLAFVVWYGFYAIHTKGATGTDDREYVAIARNICEGEGIVRNLIYPVDIKFFSKPPIPEFHHPPGISLDHCRIFQGIWSLRLCGSPPLLSLVFSPRSLNLLFRSAACRYENSRPGCHPHHF